MSHFAALAAKTDDGWNSSEVELDGLVDIDEVADVMRDVSVDEGPVLLFVEEDDEWFAIVRVDGIGEPRTFISDARVVAGSQLAAKVFEDDVVEEIIDLDVSLDEDAEIEEEEEERPALRPDAEPQGALDVLVDFGITSAQLLALCAEEGMLPADVIAAICERLGCAEEIEVYR